MATVYSDQYGKTLENPTRRMDSTYEGPVKFLSDTYTVTGALAENTVIDFGLIPTGAKVLDVYFNWTDIDTGSTATLDVGYTGVADAFFNGKVAGTAGSARFGDTGDGSAVGVVTAAAGKHLIVSVLDAGTSETPGSISLVLTYVLD